LDFNITVVQTSFKTATSKAGKPYKLYEVAYRNNTFDGKLEEAKINQYSKVFKEAGEMQAGSTYDISKEKDDSGYYQWLSVKQQAPGTSVAGMQAAAAPQVKKEGYVAPKSTYETPEERAKKQVYIVKQSSIGSAIELLSIGAKTPPSAESVLKLAQEFTDFVFAEKKVDLFDTPNDNLDGEVV
jgi:hypothetical protein